MSGVPLLPTLSPRSDAVSPLFRKTLLNCDLDKPESAIASAFVSNCCALLTISCSLIPLFSRNILSRFAFVDAGSPSPFSAIRAILPSSTPLPMTNIG